MRKDIGIKFIIAFLTVIIISIIIYFIIIITNQKNDKENQKVSEESNLNESIELDYNNFYTLENIMKKIIQYIKDENYNTIYKLLDKEAEVSKEELYTILEEYKSAITLNDDIKYLIKADIITNNIYLCEFEVAGYRQSIKIKINKITSTFSILELEKWGYVDD